MICQELSQVLETLYSGKYELAIRNLKAQKQKKKKRERTTGALMVSKKCTYVYMTTGMNKCFF